MFYNKKQLTRPQFIVMGLKTLKVQWNTMYLKNIPRCIIDLANIKLKIQDEQAVFNENVLKKFENSMKNCYLDLSFVCVKD